MEKTKLLYIVCLLISCLLLSNGIAQEYAAQWHLPEGAKARLGSGKLNNVIFSPRWDPNCCVNIHRHLGLRCADQGSRFTVRRDTGWQTGKVFFLKTAGDTGVLR